MTREKFFTNLTIVSAMVVSMIPLALCFGFMVSDVAVFFHRLIVLGLVSLITMLVSAVIAFL